MINPSSVLRTTIGALFLVLLSLALSTTGRTSAFVVVAPTSSRVSLATTAPTQLNMVFNKKNNKKDDDLSYIETRDMTPAEMRALNAKNEEIMNAELVGMTVFSLILSIPMLYLVWVGFFSETAGTVDDALPY